MRSGVAAVAAICLLAPAGASAATRYVSPHGADTGACSRSAPCSVAWAVNGGGSAPGDEIFLASGTYVDQPLVLDRTLLVTARPDAPRPVFRATAPGAVALTVAPGGADSVIEHLVVQATADGAVGVDLQSPATVDDVSVTTATAACLRSAATGVRISSAWLTQTGLGTEPCLQTTGDDTFWDGVRVTAPDAEVAAVFSGDGTITDATISGELTGLQLEGTPAAHRVTASGEQRGIVLTGTTMLTDTVAIARRGGAAVFAGSGSHELLNVTAWGAGAGSIGIRATTGAQLTVKNTIARGRAADVAADPATTTIGPNCSAVRGCPAGRLQIDHSNWRTGPGVEDLGANQSGSPRFVAPAYADFRLRRDSPAIDAGSFEFNSGSADRAGRFRWLGLRPDMGAYEYPSPRPAQPPLENRHPRFGVVRLTRSVFRVSRRGAAFVSAAHRSGAGTTLVVAVSEPADLVARVYRVGRVRSMGTFVRPVRRGTTRVGLSGRLDGRPLPPGRYHLKLIARDVAQNLSRPRHLTFRIVR